MEKGTRIISNDFRSDYKALQDKFDVPDVDRDYRYIFIFKDGSVSFSNSWATFESMYGLELRGFHKKELDDDTKTILQIVKCVHYSSDMLSSRILNYLMEHEDQTPEDIRNAINDGVSQNMSRRLSELEDFGFIQVTKKTGKVKHYSANVEEVERIRHLINQI